jgi:hypothetical protein
MTGHAKRAFGAPEEDEIVTPGEMITDDPQWMRYLFTPLHSQGYN